MSSQTKPKLAAAMLVLNSQGQILYGKRARALPFLGGFVATPGGRVDLEDRTHPLFSGDSMAAEKTAALRELAEETGLVVHNDRLVSLQDAKTWRQHYLQEPLDGKRLIHHGRWTTPDYGPAPRFDTHHFLLRITDSETPITNHQEFDWLSFETPHEIFARYLRLELLLTPPNRASLEALTEAKSDEEQLHRLRKKAQERGVTFYDFEPASGIRVFPQKSPTLPPATHTNATLLGHQKLIVIDPAAYDRPGREIFLGYLDRLMSAGAEVIATVLTHHHVDHIGAATFLREERNIPIWAHERTRDLVDFSIDRCLLDQEVICLGKDRNDELFTVRIWHTPGHAPGHLILIDERERAQFMVVGDMVAAIGYIIIDPPEGDMSHYLRQLERMRTLPEKVMFPAHGPPIVNGHQKLEDYIQHRLEREDKVRQALRSRGASRPQDLLRTAYADVPEEIHPFAERSCLAHLLKLVDDEEAEQHEGLFCSTKKSTGPT